MLAVFWVHCLCVTARGPVRYSEPLSQNLLPFLFAEVCHFLGGLFIDAFSGDGQKSRKAADRVQAAWGSTEKSLQGVSIALEGCMIFPQ